MRNASPTLSVNSSGAACPRPVSSPLVVGRGFVRRLPSTTDRRKVDIELTDTGLAAWHEAMDLLGEEEERIIGVLAPDERRQLSDLLRRVNLAIEHPDR